MVARAEKSAGALPTGLRSRESAVCGREGERDSKVSDKHDSVELLICNGALRMQTYGVSIEALHRPQTPNKRKRARTLGNAAC